MRHDLWVSVLVPLVLVTMVLPVLAQSPPPKPVLLPKGVADPRGHIGFVINPSGGIDAINLTTGKLLWQVGATQRPIIVTGNRLFSLAPEEKRAHAARVVVLDVNRQGEKLLTSDSLVFPAWVSLDETPGCVLRLEAAIDGHDLILRWEAHARYVGGAAAPPAIREKYKKDASGVMRVNQETGGVTSLPAPPAPEPMHANLKHVTSSPYYLGAAIEEVPLLVGNKLVALAVNESKAGEELVLRTWDAKTGKPFDPVSLRRGKGLIARVTDDKQYVIVQDEAADTATDRKSPSWVFEVTNGRPLAHLNLEPGIQAMTVLEPRLYYAVAQVSAKSTSGLKLPWTLKSADMKSGQILWERPIEGARRTPPRP
jgi:hypothetical protein